MYIDHNTPSAHVVRPGWSLYDEERFKAAANDSLIYAMRDTNSMKAAGLTHSYLRG